MTFSREAAVDYERFQVVHVEVTGDALVGADATEDHDADLTHYLVRELRDYSGFKRVTSGTGPEEREADLWLFVDVSTECEAASSEDDKEADDEMQCEAKARYTALDAEDREVDHGDAADDSDDSWDAEKGVLDEIVLHYGPAFRY